MITEYVRKTVNDYELNSLIIYQYGEIRELYEKFPGASEEILPINSCTKSILSALVCIAMEKGLFPEPDTLASDFFPTLLTGNNKRKDRITVEHLLTMTPGFQWTEFGGANSFPKMSRSEDWIQFVLDQPVTDEPGTNYIYNSGASQLVAEILKMSIRMPIAQFAEEHLFRYIGIEEYEWKTDPRGTHTGGFGMKMTARDLLNFGRLYLQRGRWNERQLISAELIDRSITPAIPANPPERGFYGWHWWIDSVEISGKEEQMNYYYARGYAGQFVFIVPDYESIVVTTRERNKKGYFPHDLFREQIAPLLTEAAVI